MNTLDQNSLRRTNSRKKSHVDIMRGENSINSVHEWPEFLSRIRLSEYTNNSINFTQENEKTESIKLKEVEVDLLLQYLVSPIIPEDPQKRSALEVISVSNHQRQFLVNKEEIKGNYKFGEANKRSYFHPEEDNWDNEFYINLSHKKIKKFKGKLDYDSFIKALELVARKIYVNIDHADAFIHLIKHKILPLYRKNVISEGTEKEFEHFQLLTQAYEILDHESVIEILSIVYKLFIPIFKKYCEKGKNKINIEAFMDWMLGFTVYPSIASRAELTRLFKYLAEITKRSEGEFDPWRLVFRDFHDSSIEGVEMMDSHMFIESLAIIAIVHVKGEIRKSTAQKEFEGKNNYVAKILLLWKRLARSMENQNIKTESQSSEEILNPLKEKYEWFF